MTRTQGLREKIKTFRLRNASDLELLLFLRDVEGLCDVVEGVVRDIKGFDQECESAQYTDTEVVWELFEAFQACLEGEKT